MLLKSFKAAERWFQAFPIGNGRLAAMVYGGVEKEIIQLNEESLWEGRSEDETYKITPEKLKEIRQSVFDGDFETAAKEADLNMLSNPSRVRSYETCGNLIIKNNKTHNYENYQRFLDTEKGIVGAQYTINGKKSESECFAAIEEDVVVYKLSSESGLDITLSFEREADIVISYHEDEICVRGQLLAGDEPEVFGRGGLQMKYIVSIKMDTKGGKTIATDAGVRVLDTNELIVYIAIHTDYSKEQGMFDHTIDVAHLASEKLANAFEKSYQEVKSGQIKAFSALANRSQIQIWNVDENIDIIEMERDTQNGREALLWQYIEMGKYMFLAGSCFRAEIPLNLQGKWCNERFPCWGSDYHLNINLQMNYWPCERFCLTEGGEPFRDYVKNLAKSGEETAKRLYFTNGWAIHHTSDIFYRTGLHDMVSCGSFPMAGPWLILQLFDDYEYNCDEIYLKDTLYPLMKGACIFLKEYLQENKEGYYVTVPSNSPENCYLYTDKNGVKKYSAVTQMPSMDNQIVRMIFSKMLYVMENFGTDSDLADELKTILGKLPPLKISERYGIVAEWIEDYEENDPGHRHISQLFGLYPGDILFEWDGFLSAAQKTIERRLSYGGGQTGWSRSWIINYYARLHNGEAAYENILEQIMLNTEQNLFDTHPVGIEYGDHSGNLFQIDGNFGALAGVAEMLLQSHLGSIGNRIIEFLPAVPNAWKDGQVKGLKARGNFVCSFSWTNKQLTSATICSLSGKRCRVLLGDKKIVADFIYTIKDDILEFDTEKGKEYHFTLCN